MLSRHDLGGRRGLTLVELVVTISILAFLLLAAAPSMATWMGNTQIRNVASAIQSGLQRARSEAVRRNEPVQFTLVSLLDSAVMDNSCANSAAGVSWVVSLDSPTGHCAQAASETTAPRIVDKHAGGAGRKNVLVKATQADGVTAASSVTFNAFGRVLSAASIGIIDVDNVDPGADYRALRLVVDLGGTVRMCEPKVTAADDPRRC